jgi:hypothetical protein
MSKQEKPPKQRKMPVARRPETKAEHMQMFLAALELAPTPTLAAQMAYVARSTVYGWRDEDPEFARKWDEAQKVGVERVERSLFERAIGR